MVVSYIGTFASFSLNINCCIKCRKLAEEELITNISSTETYQLPSGEEVETENILYVATLNIELYS